MYCPLIPLLFLEFSQTQTRFRLPSAFAGFTLSGFSGLIEYTPCLLLIDDWTGKVEIRRTALAESADGWPLGALGVTGTLPTCRASVI